MQNKRLLKVRKALDSNNIDCLLVTNPSNIFYLTGFSGVSETEREAICIISRNSIILVVPKLYQTEAKALSKNTPLKVIVSKDIQHIFTSASNIFHDKPTAGVEADNLRLSELDNIKGNFSGNVVKTSGLIEQIRIQKDKDEQVTIKKAVDITDQTFKTIKSKIKIGITEKQLARRIIEVMEDFGSEGIAFEPIVASGLNSAFPHYKTSNTKITKGILLIDAGAKYKGYCSDLTRTFYIGNPSEKFVKRYQLILNAQKKAINQLQTGTTEQYPWQQAYNSMGVTKKYFTHGLGHGVGIDIHEEPYLRKGRYNKLLKNTTITVEPGIYYPGWGGIRIEDFILLSEKGPIVLSKTPKSLEEIVIV